MARYISSAERRRKTLVLTVVALIVGLGVGFGIAKLTTTSIDDRVAQVRTDVQNATSGLSVLALHADENVGGTSDVKPVLETTRADLEKVFDEAPWLGAQTRTELLQEIDALEKMTPSGTEFGQALTDARNHINAAFGVIDR